MFNDSLYRSHMPEGWKFNPIWDHAFYFQFIPWDLYSAQSIRNGEIPLWNPYSGAGSPFLANWQSAIFSPLKIPLYLLPSAWMFEVLQIFKVWLGCLLAFIFCRALRMGGTASTVAALSFGFGGSIISSFRTFQLNTFILSPLFFLTIHRVSHAPTVVNMAWTSLSGALLILSGHPEATAYTLLGGGMYVAVSALLDIMAPGGWRQCLRKLLFSLFAIAGGLLLSSVALLPFLEFLYLEGFSYRALVSRETGPVGSLLLRAWSLMFPPSSPISGEGFSLYAGIIPLAFSLYSLRDYKRLLPLLSVLLLGMGFYFKLPPMSLLGYLPLLSRFASNYALGLVSFPLSVMAGKGLDLWLKRKKEKGLGIRTISMTFICILCIGGLLFIFLQDQLFFLRKETIPACYFHIILSLTFSLSLLLIGSYKKARSPSVLVPVVALDLFLAWGGYIPSGPLFAFPDTPPIAWLKRELGISRVMGMEGWNNIPNTGIVHRLSDGRESNPLLLRRYVRFMYAVDPDTLRTSLYIKPVEPYPRVIDSPLLDLLNMKFLLRCRCRVSGTENEAPGLVSLSPAPLTWHYTKPPPAASFTRVYSDKYVEIYENERVLPRAFIVHEAIFARSEEESFYLLTHTNIDFRKKAVIEVPDTREREMIQRGMEGGHVRPPSTAEIIAYTPMKVTVRTTLSSPGFLILGDAYTSGWKALVDGIETKVFPADLLFRGIKLSRGTHTVEFIYAPLSFTLGAIVSLFSLALVSIPIIIQKICLSIMLRKV